MNDSTKELIFLLTAFALVIAASIVACMGAAYWQSSQSCDNLHTLTGVETNVTLTNGCMVKYNGAWVDYTVMTHNKIEVTK